MQNPTDVYKKSLDKAFSQIELNPSTMDDYSKFKQGVKEESDDEKLQGGLADRETLMDLAKKHAYDDSTDSTSEKKIKSMLKTLKVQLSKGIKVEMEHTKSKSRAKDIAMDHLSEDPHYYDKLEKIEKTEPTEATGSGAVGAVSAPVAFMDSDFVRRSFAETPGYSKKIKEQVEKVEAKEATSSGAIGGYSTPSMWAKSTSKKDWGPSRKTQYKGGSFVQVKKKCTKFPYCNQGDINALKLTKNESVKEAIKRVAEKTNLSENVIRTILEHEYEKMNKRRNK